MYYYFEIKQYERAKWELLLTLEIPAFEIQDVEQPILPVSGDLIEYQAIATKAGKAKEEIVILKDQVKTERAVNAHIQLVNLVAQKIREKNGIPKSNQLIDLAVNFEKSYLFEMKSITADNARSQIRKGVSQLYEYRYLQNKPDANLVLVIEKLLNESLSWMCDYLENDRGIYLIWDGDSKLYGSNETREELKFLDLQP